MSEESLDDGLLVLRCQRGDPEAFQQQRRADNVIRSILWGVCLCFHSSVVSGVVSARHLPGTGSGCASERHQQPEMETTGSVDNDGGHYCIGVQRSVALPLSLSDPLLAAHRATAACFWGEPVFFIFWYLRGTASLVARIWLEHKKMELQLRVSERHDLENQTEPPSNPAGPSRNGPGQSQ